MVLGCKKDLVDKNRAAYVLINSKVMKALKAFESSNL